jgi:hypothetical protein
MTVGRVSVLLSVQLMEATIAQHTLRSWHATRKGFVAGFRQGRAILPGKPLLRRECRTHYRA